MSTSKARTKIDGIEVYCRFDEILELSALMPNPKNPNRHPQQQIDMLAHIIATQGWRAPITVSRRSGYIVRGHARAAAGMAIGKRAPIEYQDYESDAAEYADLIADNRIAELAVINSEDLNALLKEISQAAEGFDLELTGYTSEQLEGIISDTAGQMERERQEARSSLRARFLVPPFSVLDGRAGAWLERKTAWKNLGIRSEIGRGTDDDNTQGGLVYSRAAQSKEALALKNEYERKAGKKISWEEFANLFPHAMTFSGTSIFDPVLCEIAYRWFSPPNGKVIDPFAGGSVRGIVAALTGRDYTGIDLSARQIAANGANWESLGEQRTTVDGEESVKAPTWITGDSMHIQTLAAGEYDLLFTCPPYANLEVYSDDEADISNKEYPEFLAMYRQIIANAVALLKPNRFAVVVVGEVRDKKGNYVNFVADTVQAFLDAGMHYYNEAIYITPYGSLPMRTGRMFTATRKVGKTHQNFLVFHNGNEGESAVFDYSTADALAEDITAYLQQTQGKLGQGHQNFLVFHNGSPEESAKALGDVETVEDTFATQEPLEV